MPRYRATIEYDGTPFSGWQSQPDTLTVQGCLTEAIAKLSGETVEVRGAGRTDTGVHALGQVAHFTLAKQFPPDVVREAVNFHVRPHPIAVVQCEIVPATFDARFSAISRHYLYRIVNRRAPPVLRRDRVWWVARPLDPERMAEAASMLVGQHDFTTFRASQCQAKSPVKTLSTFSVSVVDDEIHITASARSFMHNQVRSMVGSLKFVGDGHWRASDLADALAARDRSRCGPVAPASGLYLMRVVYGEPGSPTLRHPALPEDDETG
jgi:tRNA pseudouridine38-40 synthase